MSEDDSTEAQLVVMPGRVGGSPTVGHSRLSASMVMRALRANRGHTDEEILEWWPTLPGGAAAIGVLRALMAELDSQDDLDAEQVSLATGRWRVGSKLGRTLYLDDVCVGMVDSPKIAERIVERMNATLAEVGKEAT
jgi:uncharacterized protein (DUF433 family)